MTNISRHVKKASEFIGSATALTKTRQEKRTIIQFAKKAGLVYFGSISVQSNDSRLVRGVTLSTSYNDSHYCFGAHDGYDIVCVQRLAQVRAPGQPSTKHRWFIMEFDLHTATALPHIVIGRRDQANLLYANMLSVQRDMQPHAFADPDGHHKDFARHFVTFAPPAHAPMVEFIVSPELTSAIVNHFKHLMIEVEGDSVYLLVDNPTITMGFLNKMMHYGIQFAKHIDERVGAL
jgi:hypothetical protein